MSNPLTCVNPLMNVERRLLGEAFKANLTQEGLFPCNQRDEDRDDDSTSKPKLASELTSVYPQVNIQIRLPTKCRWTLLGRGGNLTLPYNNY